VSKAREIAEERFAKGEIEENEYNRLCQLIETPSSIPTREPPPVSQTPPPVPLRASPTQTSKTPVWGKVLIGCGGFITVLLVIVYFSSAEGLAVGNLHANGTNVKFVLANNSTGSGDVVFWIEQGEFKFCEHVATVSSNTNVNFSFTCPQLRPGNLLVRVMWADFNEDAASIARRIQVR